jgi:ATP-dependent helicase/nuclease subunit A
MNPLQQSAEIESTMPADAEARAQALNIRTSCIVEAPAGSGKTGLLMQRYLKLLAEPSVTRPEEVLAITFTKKATSELRERILDQLESCHANMPVEKPFERQTRELAVDVLAHSALLGWNILEASARLNIRTIDSICAEIASSLPLLSGSGGSQRPTTDAAPLYRLAAERTLLHLGGADRELHEALRNVLLHRDGSLAEVTKLLAGMLADREQWGSLIPLGREDLAQTNLDTVIRAKLERALESVVCTALTRAANLMPSGMLHRLAALAAELGLNDGYKGGDNPLAFCTARKKPPVEAADHLEHWQALIDLLLTKTGDWRKSLSVNVVGFAMNVKEKASLTQLIDEHKSDELCAALCAVRDLPAAHYPEDQWEVTKALFHVLRRALAELKVIFAEHDVCDFTEVSIAAREALTAAIDDADEEAVDLALTSGGRLRHLLVDEMQDTSAAQYHLIQKLTHTWDGATQTLFLVGDPKQSIYLFRQAQVERFLRTMRDERLGDIPLQALRLTANFRSQANLVHAINHTFEALFPSLEEVVRSRNTAEVPFVDATPVREATEAMSMEWHAFDSGETSTAAEAKNQARAIRSNIERWLATPLPKGRTKPWSLAVLARNRSHLDPVVAELKRSAIAYRAVDIDPLATRPEVFDALALTRALLHPADRTAWLAMLRAPWCGLALADLLALVGCFRLKRKACSLAHGPFFKRRSIAWAARPSPRTSSARGAHSAAMLRWMRPSRRTCCDFWIRCARSLLNPASSISPGLNRGLRNFMPSRLRAKSPSSFSRSIKRRGWSGTSFLCRRSRPSREHRAVIYLTGSSLMKPTMTHRPLFWLLSGAVVKTPTS